MNILYSTLYELPITILYEYHLVPPHIERPALPHVLYICLTEKSAQVPLYCWNFWCIGAVPIYYAKIVLSLLEILSEYSMDESSDTILISSNQEVMSPTSVFCVIFCTKW